MRLRSLLYNGFLLFLFFVALSFQNRVFASEPDIIVFVRQGCTHCKNEEVFLSKFQKDQTDISIQFLRLENPKDKETWLRFTKNNALSKVTPITVIGKWYLVGFDNEETTGKEIKSLLNRAESQQILTKLDYSTYEEARLSTSVCPDDGSIPCSLKPATPMSVKIPFYGQLNIQKYPLIIIASLLGFLDGFNPCAMWVLVTFLIILLQVGDRKKMAIFAGVFILAEAIMYALILTVWFKTWDFVQLDNIITPVVGIVSIVGGVLFLREWRKKELVCKVTNHKERALTYNKIQTLAMSPFTVVTFIGILGVALSVNIIEFACSIGIPQTFTKILEINNLSQIQNIILILVYIFFYMLDDLFVFGLALYGADKLALTTKYSKWSNLIGGIVMIILGLILILKPQFLAF